MTTAGSKTTAEQVFRGHTLRGKTAIVTGANSGLGVETARVLALAGAARGTLAQGINLAYPVDADTHRGYCL